MTDEFYYKTPEHVLRGQEGTLLRGYVTIRNGERMEIKRGERVVIKRKFKGLGVVSKLNQAIYIPEVAIKDVEIDGDD